MTESKWRNLIIIGIFAFIGFNNAQPLSSFGRRSGSLGSRFEPRFSSSSGSSFSQGSWLSAPPSSASISGLQTSGSLLSRRVVSPGNRFVIGTGSSTLQLPQQLPVQTAFTQQTIQQPQPQQIHQVHVGHQPTMTIGGQQRGSLVLPRQSAIQSQVAQPQQVVQTVQQVQPVAPIQQVQQVAQLQPQTVQTTFTGAAIQAPSIGGQVTGQRGATLGVPQSAIGTGLPANPFGQMGGMPMGSPMGMAMGSPMGMMGAMGAMNPMASMMGMGMGMGPMGMPFMSYDTMEDLLLDGPDRRAPPVGALAASAVASGMSAGAALGAGVAPAVPAVSAPAAGQTASAASVGLGHLAAPGGATSGVSAGSPAVAAPAAGSPAAGSVAAQVNPAVIQSALQTALSRVQQRQSPQAVTVG